MRWYAWVLWILGTAALVCIFFALIHLTKVQMTVISNQEIIKAQQNKNTESIEKLKHSICD